MAIPAPMTFSTLRVYDDAGAFRRCVSEIIDRQVAYLYLVSMEGLAQSGVAPADFPRYTDLPQDARDVWRRHFGAIRSDEHVR